MKQSIFFRTFLNNVVEAKIFQIQLISVSSRHAISETVNVLNQTYRQSDNPSVQLPGFFRQADSENRINSPFSGINSVYFAGFVSK